MTENTAAWGQELSKGNTVIKATEQPATTLVVLVHGYESSASKLHHLVRVIHQEMDDFKSADIFVPQYAAHKFSTERLWDVTNTISLQIERIINPNPSQYQNIVLIGHSLGALIVRKLYVFSCGIGEPKPNTTESFRAKHEWSMKVSRIILLAGMNRGWSLEEKPELMAWRRYFILKGLVKLARMGRKPLLVFDAEKGAPFVADLRLQWRSIPSKPIVIQMQGRHDDIVSRDDNLDIMFNSDSFIREVPSSGHYDIISFRKPEKKPFCEALWQWLTNPIRYSAGEWEYRQIDFEYALRAIKNESKTVAAAKANEAREKLAQARQDHETSPCQDSKKKLDESVAEEMKAKETATQLNALPTLHSHYSPPILDRIDTTTKHVILVVHGIRDRGQWTERFKDHAKTRGKVHCKVGSYGYFGMLDFLSRVDRNKNVRWLMSEFSDAKLIYPNAEIHFVGHSNGTYVGANALKLYHECAFTRIVLGGSVLPSNFEWDKLSKKYCKLKNYFAIDDMIVALIPNGYEFFKSKELGGAGFLGFTNDAARIARQERLIGGHSAITSRKDESDLQILWDHMLNFLIDGTEAPLPDRVSGGKIGPLKTLHVMIIDKLSITAPAVTPLLIVLCIVLITYIVVLWAEHQLWPYTHDGIGWIIAPLTISTLTLRFFLRRI